MENKLVLATIITFPKEQVVTDFENNGLFYKYKLVPIETQSNYNLYIEIIYTSNENVCYLEPEHYEDNEVRQFLSFNMIEFLMELKLNGSIYGQEETNEE